MASFVLFDLDNTLVDRQLAYVEWVKAFVAHNGLGDEAVRLLCDADEDGYASRHAVFDVARRQLGLKDSIDDLIARYRTEYPTHFSPDHAVNQSLRRLRSHNVRIGIITNGPSTQEEKVERAGLLPLIDALCISEELGVEKPDERIFREAIQQCRGDQNPVGGWMVGDSAEHDIGGGQRVGLRTAWISRGRAWDRKEFFPEVIASNVTDAVEVILNSSRYA